jgi:hypothetical protein
LLGAQWSFLGGHVAEGAAPGTATHTEANRIAEVAVDGVVLSQGGDVVLFEGDGAVPAGPPTMARARSGERGGLRVGCGGRVRWRRRGPSVDVPVHSCAPFLSSPFPRRRHLPGRQVLSAILPFVSRFRGDLGRAGRVGGSYDHLALGRSLCSRTGTTSKLRCAHDENNLLEQDHRGIQRRADAKQHFRSFGERVTRLPATRRCTCCGRDR